jgi:S-methylmethionine-dependent homocysteine/selenocysteine methylase
MMAAGVQCFAQGATSITPETARSVSVMDGSMGQLLIDRGVPKDTTLWSARGLVEEKYHPIIVQAHVDYIRSGAVMITTSSYAVQPTYYQAAFSDWESRMVNDTEVSVKLAMQARSQCGAEDSVRILGCLPPICQTFRPDLAEQFVKEKGEDACVKIYRTIAEALLRGGADAFLGETLNGWCEAQLVIEATKDLNVPLIVSLEGSLRGTNLKPQPHIAPEVAREILMAKLNGAPIEALSFNCAPPEDILALASHQSLRP